jgi:hypothetical protein
VRHSPSLRHCVIGATMTLLSAWVSPPDVERVARCRSLAMGARLLAGDNAAGFCAALALAEIGTAALADVGPTPIPETPHHGPPHAALVGGGS